jgi:hypothetical protein
VVVTLHLMICGCGQFERPRHSFEVIGLMYRRQIGAMFMLEVVWIFFLVYYVCEVDLAHDRAGLPIGGR